MKNILVLKNYTLTDQVGWYNDRSHESDLSKNYKSMEEIAVATAQKHIQQLDEVKVFRGNADNIRDVFKLNFYEIYELWKEGNNILYCDLDVVFTKPVSFFEEQDSLFRMYNFTDPTHTVDNHYNLEFEHYFNCGIRYYPSNMSQSVWDVGIAMVENWNPDRWDSEQIIYNAMMWSQQKHPDVFYMPHCAYQMLHNPHSIGGNSMNTQFNQIKLEQASVIHVHGSRGSMDRLGLMKVLATAETRSNSLTDESILIL